MYLYPNSSLSSPCSLHTRSGFVTALHIHNTGDSALQFSLLGLSPDPDATQQQLGPLNFRGRGRSSRASKQPMLAVLGMSLGAAALAAAVCWCSLTQGVSGANKGRPVGTPRWDMGQCDNACRLLYTLYIMVHAANSFGQAWPVMYGPSRLRPAHRLTCAPPGMCVWGCRLLARVWEDAGRELRTRAVVASRSSSFRGPVAPDSYRGLAMKSHIGSCTCHKGAKEELRHDTTATCIASLLVGPA
jgi:hypothetical protein